MLGSLITNFNLRKEAEVDPPVLCKRMSDLQESNGEIVFSLLLQI